MILNSLLCNSWNNHYVWIVTYARMYAAVSVDFRLKIFSCAVQIMDMHYKLQEEHFTLYCVYLETTIMFCKNMYMYVKFN